jgi:hypothetical protein
MAIELMAGQSLRSDGDEPIAQEGRSQRAQAKFDYENPDGTPTFNMNGT